MNTTTNNTARLLLLIMCFSLSLSSHAGWLSFLKGKGYTATQYPIVMVGGAFAFDKAMGIDYWYGITDRLRDGGANVYVTNLSSASSNERRGEELLVDIQNILDLTGAEKVNLIAHSQGALAARYVAAIRSDRIASVTSVHGMNRGTHFSTGFRSAIPEGGTIEALGAPLIDSIFNILETLSTDSADGDYNSEDRPTDQSILVLADATDPVQIAQFNAVYPAGLPSVDCFNVNGGLSGDVGSGAAEVNGVRYYSWGGVKEQTNLLDPIDLFLITAFNMFVPADIEWDGLVPGCGQSLGQVIRNDYRANHFDAINQFTGLTAFAIDIPSIYAQQANRLKKAGL